ncbi:MAG: DNA recombination protein RmuC [Oligoflexales bacterium]|nr:DNA recombination protein RmuC [Oligoflexales bacterium]
MSESFDLFLLAPMFVLVFASGLLLGFYFRHLLQKSEKRFAENFMQQSIESLKDNLSSTSEHLKANFSELSMRALSASNSELLKLAKNQLSSERELTVKEVDTQKQLIQAQLTHLNSELDKMRELVKTLEKDRENKFSDLITNIKHSNLQTRALLDSTQELNKILGHSQDRGQWGERVAEDVLRFAGFIEHVNYRKQNVSSQSQSRPDYTFLLPGGRVLNMDVKFPLDNYRKMLASTDDQNRDHFKKLFLRDIKLKLKEASSRDYINTEDNTLDVVLLFVPNEQIFHYIIQEDIDLVDSALRNKVICCSPISLFPILAVIRQAVDQFSLEKQSNVILQQLALFKKNWLKFLEGFEKIGKRIQDLQRDYDTLMTTRVRQLEKPLDKLEDIRIEKNLELAAIEQPQIEN